MIKRNTTFYKVLITIFILYFACIISSVKAEGNNANLSPFPCVEYNEDLVGTEYELDDTARSIEPNVVHYNLVTHQFDFMYLNNSFNTILNTHDSYSSYTQSFPNDGTITSNSGLANNMTYVSNTSLSPYNKIGRITNDNYWGTAFLMGPNIALTAGHCVWDSENNSFINNIRIDFGDNGTTISRSANVTDVFILKVYYDSFSFANDWAICILDSSIGDELGFFGKCSGYNLIGKEAKVIGYPGGQSTNSQYITRGEIRTNSPTINYYAYSTGGLSGGPVFVTIDGYEYVAGIHSFVNTSINGSIVYYSGAAKITDFLFDFLNYFLVESNKGVEIRDYYYDGLTKIRYNTMSEVIVTPRDNLRVYLGRNPYSFTQINSQSHLFYTSSTTSNEVDFDYTYFRYYDTTTNTMSSAIYFGAYFSDQSMTAEYSIVNKTNNGDIIPRMYDQRDNVWYHNGSRGHVIKGTIAYNGFAKNIEVTIPRIGTNTSQYVTIDGVDFRIRAGVNRVSLIASSTLECSDNFIFAFGVD